MNIVLSLLKKDLLRDWKHPWGTLIMISIPLLMGSIISIMFGGSGEKMAKRITVPIAIMDEDDSFFSGMLRSISSQGDANQQIQLRLVDKVEDGIALLEKRRAAAFLVLPKNMTSDLLNGATAAIQLYKNPAQALLPKIVEQGADLLAVGISEAINLVGPELQTMKDFINRDVFPTTEEATANFEKTMDKMRGVQTYFFPPIITFRVIAADDYIASVSKIENASPSLENVHE
ncbi:MAG: ABC transporter permease [Candidatus Omnitrophota bacterium]